MKEKGDVRQATRHCREETIWTNHEETCPAKAGRVRKGKRSTKKFIEEKKWEEVVSRILTSTLFKIYEGV